MSTFKTVQSSAPYNHDTFNTLTNYIVGQNGVISGGAVTTAGSLVTIQPLTWVQNGLIVSVPDITLTATLPSFLTAPYYVAVTTSTAIENPSEIITPTFVKRPEDVSTGTVLVAEWDGNEWRQLPYLDISGVVQSQNSNAVNENLIGIGSGFDITQDSGHIYVDGGAARAVDGSLVFKSTETTFTKAATDPDSLNRIDEVVLRKPQDTTPRIATLEYVVGQTCNAGGTVELFSPVQVSSLTSTASKTLNNPTNDDLYFLYLEGTTLQFRSSSDDLSGITAPVSLASGVGTFDSIFNPDGSIDVVYTSSGSIYYFRVDTTGSFIYGASQIYMSSNPVSNVKMVSVLSSGTYFLHIIFQQYVSPTQNDIWYTRLTSSDTIETTPVLFVTMSAQLQNPSLDKSDDDSTLLLAFESVSSGAVYLGVYDAGTATGVAPPTALTAPFTLQSDTYDISTSTLLASTGAKNAIVKIADNKEVYVFWLHPAGGGTFAVAVYNRRYITLFGHQAVVTQLYTSGENYSVYDVALDGLSYAHIIGVEASNGAVAANLQLDSFTASAQVQVDATGTDVRTLFTTLGSLIHSYADTTPSSNLVKSTAGLITTLRDRVLPFTDVYMAHYRTGDGVISVAGTAIEEDPSISRLYEFNNIFASTGSVVWGGSSTHTLVIALDLTINGFNRSGTLTIPANGPDGIVIPDGSVAYVDIPDEDVTQDLTINVTEFGEGVLDRYGRVAVPIFWCVAGVLYTKFAPFRMSAAGETVVIGHSLTQAERDWIGMPEDPDPTNHGYTSTVHIAQDMSHNEAIGVLDAAITGGGGSDTFTSGNVALTNGTTTQVVTFSTAYGTTNYRVTPSLENDTDVNPQFQPITITNKLTTGFTATWNAPLDSGNYSLNYLALIDGNDAGSQALTIGTQTQTVTFGTARGTSLYKPIPIMENTTDVNPQFQPMTITNKTVNGFTVNWNAPLDSSNYTLDWIVAD